MTDSLKKGYIHVYTGDGKGKTTAALGLAVRASGHGMKTYMGQFMKGQSYGELSALKDNPYITIEQYGDVSCIRKEEVTEKHVNQAEKGLKKIKEAIFSSNYDIIILDEINVALWFELLQIEDVIHLLKNRPEQVEVILTGRKAPPELIAIADLVSEVKDVKHYYYQGVQARNGIER